MKTLAECLTAALQSSWVARKESRHGYAAMIPAPEVGSWQTLKTGRRFSTQIAPDSGSDIIADIETRRCQSADNISNIHATKPQPMGGDGVEVMAVNRRNNPLPVRAVVGVEALTRLEAGARNVGDHRVRLSGRSFEIIPRPGVNEFDGPVRYVPAVPEPSGTCQADGLMGYPVAMRDRVFHAAVETVVDTQRVTRMSTEKKGPAPWGDSAGKRLTCGETGL